MRSSISGWVRQYKLLLTVLAHCGELAGNLAALNVVTGEGKHELMKATLWTPVKFKKRCRGIQTEFPWKIRQSSQLLGLWRCHRTTLFSKRGTACGGENRECEPGEAPN